MRRSLALTLVSIVALLALGASALAATPRPVISSVSPTQARIGQTLTLKGKNFARGARVYFRRASDGKTVRTRAKSATKTRLKVVVPARLDQFLTVGADGSKQPTRFQIGIFTRTFGPYTRKSRSPLILPATSTPGAPGSPGAPAPPPCPGPDPNADSDGDHLSNGLEAQIHTDPCKIDTDGDGISDAYEYYSALDFNNAGLGAGNSAPYPGTKPYPNPLDGSDAKKDFDGDGLTMADEYAAWAKYGGGVLPSAGGQTFPYSDGNQYSSAGGGAGFMDLDNNGRISDDEKDVDSDGLPNWVELAKGENTPPSNGQGTCAFSASTGPNAQWDHPNVFTDCGAGLVPNGNTFKPFDNLSFEEFNPDWLNPDSDGDGIPDGADDNDHDGLSNRGEITGNPGTAFAGMFTSPQEPCDPDPQAPLCERHTR